MEDLNKALMQSNYDLVKVLLDSGTEWDMPDYMTERAIGNMLRREAYDIIKILINKEIISLDIFEYDNFNNTLFKHFIDAPFSDKLFDFLQSIIGDVDNIDDELGGQSWLGLAIEKKADLRVIELLLDSGCDANKISTREENYLFATTDLALTELLVNRGLDINKKNLAGKTPFFRAVASKDKELIQYYLDNGADINAQDNQGETVYNVLCFYVLDGGELFELLANYDPPRFDLKNKDGQSIFMEMARKVEWENEINLLGMMLDHGADLFQEDVDIYQRPTTASDLIATQPVAVLEMIAKKGLLDVEAIDTRGNTWLHKVCKQELNFEEKKAKKMYRKVKFLLKAGANPNLKNDEDKSPIDYAQEDNLKAKALQIMLKK